MLVAVGEMQKIKTPIQVLKRNTYGGGARKQKQKQNWQQEHSDSLVWNLPLLLGNHPEKQR